MGTDQDDYAEQCDAEQTRHSPVVEMQGTVRTADEQVVNIQRLRQDGQRQVSLFIAGPDGLPVTLSVDKVADLMHLLATMAGFAHDGIPVT